MDQMDRQDIERLAKMEEQLNQLSDKLDKIQELMEDYNSHQYECEKKFVKIEDFTQRWEASWKKHEEEKLQKSNNYINLLNNAYKLILTAAGIVILINQIITK